MSFYDFRVWCENAVDGIVFPPDRKQVYEELLSHLYDHYDDFVAQGMDRETACQAALDAMGDAREIAPQLAAIHRPFWGYFLRFTRVLLVLSLCAAVLCGGFWMRYVNDYAQPYEGDSVNPFDPYAKTQHDSLYTTQTRTFYAEPNQSAESDGYTLTLTRAALWSIYHLNEEKNSQNHDCLYFQIEVFNPRPWAEHREMGHWFWGVDSLGNVYDSFHKGIINYAPYISCHGYHTAPLTYTYDMYIGDYRSQEAEWIEFHYDRSGRDIVFHVDLTGGEAA